MEPQWKEQRDYFLMASTGLGPRVLTCGAFAGAGEGSSLSTAMGLRGCSGIPVSPTLNPARMWLIQGQHWALWPAFPAAGSVLGHRVLVVTVPCLAQKCSRSGRFILGRTILGRTPVSPSPHTQRGVIQPFLAFLAGGGPCYGGTTGEWWDGAI